MIDTHTKKEKKDWEKEEEFGSAAGGRAAVFWAFVTGTGNSLNTVLKILLFC